ncbi:hypothetical protein ZWY2020_013437 [Hordeum vulgare]|nr:hypothetical protein ZWY2020_013437 [Hordeum vulgare]
MAPPPPATAAAATAEEFLEVLCVGCEEKLEVERGLTEFVCPDCATPQSLPGVRAAARRRALPLPRGAADARGRGCRAAHAASSSACPSGYRDAPALSAPPSWPSTPPASGTTS